MNSLLEGYDDSDEERASRAQAPPAAAAAAAAAATTAATEGAAGAADASAAAEGVESGSQNSEPPVREPPEAAAEAAEVRHGSRCDCEECAPLLARFAAKHLQTKGIRFRCKLCSETTATKAAAGGHFQAAHAAALQEFKKHKAPRLLDAPAAAQAARLEATCKVSFAREDVLKKRPADADASFGGWAKKEKPEPPPCERPEYQDQMEPVLTAPPWLNQQTPTNEDATAADKEVDRHIAEAQLRRFSKRNILEVKSTTVRCKLCYKTFGSSPEAERHVVETHREDFAKELGVWERFLHTTCKRQPPFGWVCKVCNLFFPSDGATWRHCGKEVFIRREERHINNWHEREDRWGHEEDEECCGDGINFARGMSYDSVKLFREEARRQKELEDAKRLGVDSAPDKKEDEEAESADEGPAAEEGAVRFIQEF